MAEGGKAEEAQGSGFRDSGLGPKGLGLAFARVCCGFRGVCLEERRAGRISDTVDGQNPA